MTDDLKKLFENRTVELSIQVTAERARLGGIVLGDDLGLKSLKAKPRIRYPDALVKRLAGGRSANPAG
jgi:hypothetical protein